MTATRANVRNETPARSALSDPRRRSARRPPPLGPHHYAFFRGVVLDGLDKIEMARRYLPVRPLESAVNAHLRWIRDQLIRHAKRLERWQLARTLERPLPPPVPAAGPSIEEFRQREDPDDFYSEAELLKLYAAAYPDPPERRRARSRRAWAVRRLRQAVAAIERYAVVPPQPIDPVESWLAPGVARRLTAAGVTSLTDLATLVDERGARWHAKIDGIGPAKAAAVGLWLRANVPGFEQRVGERSLLPQKALKQEILARPRPTETGVVPFEYFHPSEACDGRLSPYRRPPAAGGLPAIDDRDAVNGWLRTHLTVEEIRDPLTWERNATFRAYRREVERLWSWAVVERGKALSALTDADVAAYQLFLLDPQPRERWVGPRQPRWHPRWRPFTAAPSPRSRDHILTIIGSLYEWWFRQGYIVRNPWRAGPKRTPVERPQFARRSLSLPAWDTLRQSVTALPAGEKRERLRALLALLYGSGVRRAELAAATVQQLQSSRDSQGELHWDLTVRGKRRKVRTVPIAAPAMEALQDYFEQRFGDRSLPVGDDPVPLFATLPSPIYPSQPRSALSAWGINAAVCEALAAAAADAAEPAVSIELRRASAHWLRHTFATHAVMYDGARLEVLQKVLGHASITTTAGNYVDEDAGMRQDLARKVAQRTWI